LLRAEIAIAAGDSEAARRDLQSAQSSLDTMGVSSSHPLRAAMAALRDRLSATG
jgi:hypothetical protein